LIKSIAQCQTSSFPAQVWQLDHGLTVIHQYLPVTPVVVVDVWVKAGAIAEPDSWLGMAHFLEHMIFKGTEKLPPGLFDYLIENCGGMTNAATSHDYAHFYLTTSVDQIEHTLPHLAEILLHAEIDDEEFYREKDVVLEELRSCYDDPDWIAYQTLCGSIYQNHPYGRSILGDEPCLAQLTPNQMRCFHRTYYQPENICVAIIGGIEQEQATKIIRQSFGQFPIPSESPPNSVAAEPPLVEIRRSQVYLPHLEHSRLLMGWMGPGCDRLEDAFGLDLLSVILAGGRCSRLVRHLREEAQIVLDIDSNFSLQRDSSLFTIGAWLSSSQIDVIEALICEHLQYLHNHSVTPEELHRAQQLLANDYIFSTETPGQLAGLYGYYQTLKSANLATIYPQVIQSFRPQDIQRLARQFLSTERYAITIMQPCE
jgi:predicted Zn-dependent peptidase